MTPEDLIRKVSDANKDQLTDALVNVIDAHEPIHALDYGVQPVRELTQVCTGCGQDNGNWNYWPCPTIRAIQEALTGGPQ